MLPRASYGRTTSRICRRPTIRRSTGGRTRWFRRLSSATCRCAKKKRRTHSTQLPSRALSSALALLPHCLLCPPSLPGARHPIRAPRDARLPAARQLAIGSWRRLRPSGGRGRDPAERLARRGGRRAAWGVEMRDTTDVRDCGHIRTTTPSHVDRCTHACGLREHDPPVCMYEDGMRNS